MLSRLATCVAVAAILLAASPVHPVAATTNSICLGCTLVVGVIEGLAQVHNETIVDAMDRFCGYLPPDLQPTCNTTVDLFGPEVIVLLENDATADVVCQTIDLCSNPQCHLYPPPSKEWISPITVRNDDDESSYAMERKAKTHAAGFEWPWQWIESVINTTFNYHKAAQDLDGDLFGAEDMLELRGSGWKGGDCDDTSADIHPGRADSSYDADIDHDCNGIYGSNSEGVSYEELLCGNTSHMGIALLGDSVGAHFYGPPEWLEAEQINDTTYANMIEIGLMELDWPFMSATTGYMYSDWYAHPIGNVTSIYQAMRERNRCVHRDFQNCAVNGARSSAMLDNIQFSLARDHQHDYPLYVSYALIGNDVCNGHPGMTHMTTPEEMYDNVMGTLTYLDTLLPMGSYVTITGLINGSIIYENLAERWWPLGKLNKDITFTDYWEWLNCLESNPCHGWMTTNATLRNLTTERAFALNDALMDVVNNNTFKNFEVYYIDNPFAQILDEWVADGGQAWQLFEQAIGMHPNQIANNLLGEYFQKFLAANYPQLLGAINPNNAEIEQLFGDQGGYT